jgi:hypothetical protein
MAPAAPAARGKRKPASGGYSQTIRNARAKERAAVLLDVNAAAAWCAANAAGATKALKTGRFARATVGKVKKAVARLTKGACVRDHHRQTLTNSERELLAEWLLNEANHHTPKTRSDISAKARELLKARHAYNKSKKWGKGTVALTDLEVSFANGTGDLSNTFFQNTFPWWRARGINIDLGVSRSQEEKRSKKMREPVVQNHFYGEFGLEAELVDAGIMDTDSMVCCAPPPLYPDVRRPHPTPPSLRSSPTRGACSTATRRRSLSTCPRRASVRRSPSIRASRRARPPQRTRRTSPSR